MTAGAPAAAPAGPAPLPDVADSYGCASSAVAFLRGVLGAGISIETHPGTFDIAALKTFSQAAPAVRIATLGFGTPKLQGNGQVELPVNVTAAILTISRGALSAAQAANALATAVIVAIADDVVGVGNGWPVTELKAHNEYSGRLQDFAGDLALWQVTWTQRIVLGVDVFAAADATAWGQGAAGGGATVARQLARFVTYGTDAPPKGRTFDPGATHG